MEALKKSMLHPMTSGAIELSMASPAWLCVRKYLISFSTARCHIVEYYSFLPGTIPISGSGLLFTFNVLGESPPFCLRISWYAHVMFLTYSGLVLYYPIGKTVGEYTVYTEDTTSTRSSLLIRHDASVTKGAQCLPLSCAVIGIFAFASRDSRAPRFVNQHIGEGPVLVMSRPEHLIPFLTSTPR